MKRCFALLCLLVLLVICAMPVAAADGKVVYKGDADQFVFTPGSDYSPTDRFPNFKDVMPGDFISQKITVRNNASNKVKAEIYIRSLGAQKGSEEFLSQLHLRVEKSQDNSMGYMFEAAADETAQLTDWVLLGTLYSGGEVDLNVMLDVPVTLDNRFQKQIGYLDWEFKVEKFPVDPSDPQPPQTGDETQAWLWGSLAVVSLVAIVILLPARKRKEKEE